MNKEEVKEVICPFCESTVDTSIVIDYEKIKYFEDLDEDKIACICSNCNYIFFKKEGEIND